jgi:hypothetical protein
MFWTLLLIHYHADNLNTNITTKIAYSTYSKCGQAMTPILKVVQREYPDAWVWLSAMLWPDTRLARPHHGSKIGEPRRF